MSRDFGLGDQTGAFMQWETIDGDQRVFLSRGLRIAREADERVWDEAAAEPGDPDGPELHEVYYERVGGLWPSEYEWMHEAGVLRDAVTNFEVYLEQVRAEVPSQLAKPSRNEPHWGDLRDFFAKLDIAIETEEVTRVRDLRHLLTHQRGALRTEARRAKFAGAVSPYSIESPIVDLSEEVVVQAMDALAATVHRVDALVWQLRS